MSGSAAEGFLQSTAARVGTFTSLVSSQVRTVALAAIAMSWAFAGGFTSTTEGSLVNVGILRREPHLELSLVWAVVAIVLDIAQYAWTAILSATFHWYASSLLSPMWTTKLSVGQRLGIWVAKERGLFRFVERQVGLSPRGEWRHRRTALRRLVVRAASRDDWPDGTAEGSLAVALDILAMPPARLAAIAFVGKVACVGVAYWHLLRFLI